MLTPEQIDRIQVESSINSIRSFATLVSTNDQAKAMCGAVDLDLPCLIIAANQTAGRGRGANVWVAGEGALTFSIIHDGSSLCDRLKIAPQKMPAIALCTALAVRNAVADIVDVSFPAQVKWPNDVYLAGGKVAGILIETVSHPVPRVVIGIGLNVNNRPPEYDQRTRAVSMGDATGARLQLPAVLLRVLQRLDELGTSQMALSDAWRPHCLLRTRRVNTSAGTGICEGVSDDGALLLRTEQGLVEVRSGSVELVRK